MIAVIDYGAGNLHSVKNALDHIGAESIITGNADEILAADAVILPGVGAFGDCMASLSKNGLVDTVKTAAKSGKPFLGICLGLQLLFEESEESPGVSGLGIFKGKIVKIPEYGENLTVAVERDNIFAVQFHPGKSGDAGMEILKKFAALGGKC